MRAATARCAQGDRTAACHGPRPTEPHCPLLQAPCCGPPGTARSAGTVRSLTPGVWREGLTGAQEARPDE